LACPAEFRRRSAGRIVSTHRISVLLAILLVAAPVRAQTPDPDEARIDDLIVASRILAHQGILDSFGHVARARRTPTTSSCRAPWRRR
jgi:hypothetical protein